MDVIVLVRPINRQAWLSSTSDAESNVISRTDRIALQRAVEVKQRYGGHVIAISLGSLDSQNALSETLAIGADRAVLLHDDLFEGADAHATVTVLEAAVTRILDYDLILCGACSDDLSEFQVGPRLAEVCNLPIITYAKKISLEGRNVVVERELEHERQTVEARLPCLITMLSDDGLDRRFEKITVSASNKRIEIWDAADLNLSDHEVGFSGSLVEVLRSREYPPDRTARMLTGNVEELVPKVVETLKREGALRLE